MIFLEIQASYAKEPYIFVIFQGGSGPPVPLPSGSAHEIVQSIDNVLREKSLAIYFGDSQFRRNRTFNFIVSKVYVDKRS